MGNCMEPIRGYYTQLYDRVGRHNFAVDTSFRFWRDRDSCCTDRVADRVMDSHSRHSARHSQSHARSAQRIRSIARPVIWPIPHDTIYVDLTSLSGRPLALSCALDSTFASLDSVQRSMQRLPHQAGQQPLPNNQ
jgi:hypothetical protein